jgi:integrase
MAPGSWGDITFRTTTDGTYIGRVTYRRLDGQRREATANASTKIGVDRKLKLKLPALIAEAAAPPTQALVTFEAVVSEWLQYEELKLPDHLKARGTHAEHLRMLSRHLLPAFGDALVAEITPAMIFQYYTGLAATHAPLARNVKVLLKQILDHAVNLGHLEGPNPATTVKTLRRPKKQIFAPEVDELKMLRDATLSYMHDVDRPGPTPSMLLLDCIDLILATGERISEVLGLRFEKDIHLGSDVPFCTVNGAIKEKGGPKRWEPFPKTEAGRRELALPDYAVAIILRRSVENTTRSEFLFHTRTGAPNGPQDVHRTLRLVRQHGGLPDNFVPHALRKTVATQVARTLGLDAAAMVLGHSRARVTEQSYVKRDLRAPDARDLLQSQMEAITRVETPTLRVR